MDQMEAAIAAFDQRTEQIFAKLRGNPIADRLFYSASEAANFSLLWHVLTWATATSPRKRRNALRVSTALLVEAALVNGPIKAAFNRSRPIAEHEHPHQLRQPLTSSFPSGHASAAAVATVLLAETQKRSWPLRVIATIVAASRVHVRIHHASDVAVGVCVGIVIAKQIKRLWPIH
ncbi:MAG: phosphatase PAP2 family protein [bacterium]|nr:phosphatase PAP2 family protein [bacterium]